MRFIPTRVHGMLDCVVGALLVAAPWRLNFARGGAETWIPVALGAGIPVYSALTDYELGLARVIPMPVHLALDALGGAFLALSPWIFDYDEVVWIPHVTVGLSAVFAALGTRLVPQPSASRDPALRGGAPGEVPA